MLLNTFGNAPYWPNEEKRLEISRKIGVPGCVGFLDGTELRLKDKPCRLHESFFNYKKFYSISAQAVADSENRILFWYVGPPGAVHDSRAYRQTPLHHKSNDYFSEGEFLIGDPGYSVNRHLITPFSRRGGYSPTDAEAKYNKFISQKRIEVERTFGKLQQRFNIMEEFPCRIRGPAAQMARDILWICDLSMIIINLHNYLLDSQDSFEFAAPDIYEEERAQRRGWRRRYGRRETQGSPENLSTTEDATRLFEGNEVRRYILNMVPS